MEDLPPTHAVLRAALRSAGKRIRQLQLRRPNDPALAKLRLAAQEKRKPWLTLGARQK
jgi:hypothetical protein